MKSHTSFSLPNPGEYKWSCMNPCNGFMLYTRYETQPQQYPLWLESSEPQNLEILPCGSILVNQSLAQHHDHYTRYQVPHHCISPHHELLYELPCLMHNPYGRQIRDINRIVSWPSFPCAAAMYCVVVSSCLAWPPWACCSPAPLAPSLPGLASHHDSVGHHTPHDSTLNEVHSSSRANMDRDQQSIRTPSSCTLELRPSIIGSDTNYGRFLKPSQVRSGRATRSHQACKIWETTQRRRHQYFYVGRPTNYGLLHGAPWKRYPL